MNYQELSQIRIWNKLDEQINKQRFTGQRRFSLYPSEASVVYRDEETGKAKIWGTCMRKAWYRLMKFPESDPPSVKAKYIFAFGNMIESFVVDLLKQAGLYNNNSVKFFDFESTVSGELDIVASVPVNNEEKYIILEMKSTWGGRISNGYESGSAKHLFEHYEGRGRNRHLVKGFPKENNLLQLLIYLYEFKDDPNLLGGKLLYLLRDNMNRTEFDVTIQYDKTYKKYRPVVNGEIIKGFFVEDIFDRYEYLLNRIKNDLQLIKDGKVTKNELEPPGREFILEYTDDDVEERYENGEISTTKYNNYKKGKAKLGDYQCSYCSYRSLCYNLDSNGNVIEEEINDVE